MMAWVSVGLGRAIGTAFLSVLVVGGLAGPASTASPLDSPASHPRARTEIVSWQHDGSPIAQHTATGNSSVSSDGRFVAYISTAPGIVPGQIGGDLRVYVRDRGLGTNELVSRSFDGGIPDADARAPVISGDGRWVLFASEATNIVEGDENGVEDAYLYDRELGLTERVTVATDGTESDAEVGLLDISFDGSVVAFTTEATTLDAADVDDRSDVFVRDREAGTTTLVSTGWDARHEVNAAAETCVISGDGNVVAYSGSRHSETGQRIGTQVFAFDRTTSERELVSAPADGRTTVDGGSGVVDITFDGRHVAFNSNDEPMVPGDTNHALDGFVRDRTLGTSARVTRRLTGQQIDGPSSVVGVSDDGKVATFQSSRKVFETFTNSPQIYLHDLASGELTFVTRGLDGLPANNGIDGGRLSADGLVVAWSGTASNLVEGDDNEAGDVFVLDLDPPCQTGFADVPDGHPFCFDIEWAVHDGVADGFAPGTFAPALPVSRDAATAFFRRAGGSPPFVAPTTPTFSDVGLGSVFFEDVEWAAAEGLVEGFADGTFRPGEAVRRQAVAALLHRAAGSPPFDPPATPTFPDVPVGHTFFVEVEWLADSGITGGFADGTFRPTAHVTRQELVAFLHRST
jgi:Tol biopolymer transport system component